jgi:GT2 family glycosyltransferase
VIAIVVVTYNRLHLLRQCVANVLLRTSEKTREIVIWNNASEDGTREFLDSLDAPRIRVVHHGENIGTNAYREAFKTTSQPYLVEMDDDVIEAPPRWDEALLDAFGKIPDIGYLAATLRDDPNDSDSQYIKYLREKRNAYTRHEYGDVTILEGPTGGGCTMTSRELYERVGGFGRQNKRVFWHEDAAYVRDILRLGYRAAFLEGVTVWHAGSPYYSPESPAKVAFHIRQARRRARKDFVKNVLLSLPFFARLNARHDWFDPPHRYVPPPIERFEDRALADAADGGPTEGG